MRVTSHLRTRWTFSLAFSILVIVALVRHPPASKGQDPVQPARPRSDFQTFWVTRDGLEQVDIEGEVGFTDMARLLMRRRDIRDRMRRLRGFRERWEFKVREFDTLEAPHLVRGEIRGGRWSWRLPREPLVISAGRAFNLPVIVVNRDTKASSGYFVKISEPAAGPFTRRFPVDGAPEPFEVSLDVRPLVTLRVSLLDERRKSTAARVYLTAADGLGYAPRGSFSRIGADSAEQFFHADTAFEIELPAGETVVEATRGIEYKVARQAVQLVPGKVHEVSLRLERWTHMSASRWYSADAHIHANYSSVSKQFITPADVRLQTLAEDLNYANLMVANSQGAFVHDQALFEGKPHALSRPDYLMYWNEEMRNRGLYGHMCLFNLKKLIEPVYTGFEGTPNWEDYPPNLTQAEATQKQGGAVTYAHPGHAATPEGASARELPVDLALGQVDAMDVLSNWSEEVGMELWYRLLNCGFRLAASAGTDSFTNLTDHYNPGGGRVYAHVEGSMTAENWGRSYKRGRSFITNGPMLSFTVEGREAGDEIRLSNGARHKVRVQATVRSQVPVDKVEVIVNGQSVASEPDWSRPFSREIVLTRSSWIALRALGPGHRLAMNDAHVFAHTSPVYVTIGDKPIYSREDARFYIDWNEKLIARVQEQGRFSTPERRTEVIQSFRKAQEIYRKKETGL